MKITNRISSSIRKIAPSALFFGAALLAVSPIASAHSSGKWTGGAECLNGSQKVFNQHVSWNCNSPFGCFLMVDYTSFGCPFRLAYDKGFWFKGHWYTFYHRYFVYGEGYRNPYFGTFFGMGDYQRPVYHSYYYFTY